MNKKNTSYDDFVEKFKPKKTTDDCYTPPLVYDAVLEWARKHLDMGDRPVVRPFYPGGDYEHFDYPDGCVVIDNPPFSIFANITNFYAERGIDFLLFAPAMTSIRENCTFVGVGYGVTYENGAIVNTSFVTNMMGDLICTTAPDLYKAIKMADDEIRKQNRKQLSKLSFPDCVLRASSLNTMSNAGVEYAVRREDGCVVSRVCINKTTFGSSILLSDRATAERLAAEKLAVKRLAAERLAKIKLELTPQNKEIIRQLNEVQVSS